MKKMILAALLSAFAIGAAPNSQTLTIAAGDTSAFRVNPGAQHLAICVFADNDSCVVTFYDQLQNILGQDTGWVHAPNPDSTSAYYELTKYSVDPWNLFYDVSVDSIMVVNRDTGTAATVYVRMWQ